MKRNIPYLTILLVSMANYSSFSQEKLELQGAIIIKNSEDPSPTPGTIRWTGADFEGWNGQRWISLTGYATVGSVTDTDGNIYHTARIGEMEWMVENLRVTKYRDSTIIDHITNAGIWSGLATGAWCNYDNISSNNNTYGKLYNWYAVNDNRGLCPVGWHVPTDAEWTTLIDYLGGSTIAGGKMKEEGTDHWSMPNIGATNESGFTGLPGGYCNTDGTFLTLGFEGFFWSSTESSSNNAWSYILNYSNDNVFRTFIDKRFGVLVRCVKD